MREGFGGSSLWRSASFAVLRAQADLSKIDDRSQHNGHAGKLDLLGHDKRHAK